MPRPNALRGVVSALSAYDVARATSNWRSAVLGPTPVHVVSLFANSWRRKVYGVAFDAGSAAPTV